MYTSAYNLISSNVVIGLIILVQIYKILKEFAILYEFTA